MKTIIFFNGQKRVWAGNVESVDLKAMIAYADVIKADSIHEAQQQVHTDGSQLDLTIPLWKREVNTDPRFACVVADPAWSFNNKGTRATADNHYPTMSIREVIAIPVDQWVRDTSCLFLWTTDSHLEAALQVMRYWGFVFKQTIVWVKVAETTGKIQIGLGNYLRHAHELCLFGTRGKFSVADHSLPSVFWAPRGEHSTKPEILQDWAERLVPEGPKLEMFARRARDGWSVWGNEAPA